MRRLLVPTSALFLFFTLIAITSDAAQQPSNINQLRRDNRLTSYSERDNGVPDFVAGSLGITAAKGSEVTAALAFFRENLAAYKMTDPERELSVARTDTDMLDMRHVRFQQMYRGLKVIGGDLVAHFSAQGELAAVNGFYQPGIDLEVNPRVDASQATETARRDLTGTFGAEEPTAPELVVFPFEDKYRLAWRLFLRSDDPPGRWEYFIDAFSGDIIYKANRITFDEEIGTGFGVMGQPRDHIDVWNDGSQYLMIDYSRQAANDIHGHHGQMPPGNYIKTQIAGATLPGGTAQDDDNIWDSPNDEAPAVDGQVYTALYYDWVLRVFNRNGHKGTGDKMLTIVNYSGEGSNNAYWDGLRIVVWSWSTGRRSLAGCPDVIGHEWSHAITEYTSGLVYQKESGALNESFSDMMGAAFEFAYDSMDAPDWLMGENGFTDGNAFRNMSDPHQYGDPDYYGSDPNWIEATYCTPNDGNDYCGVHTNSGVGNKWFYLLSDGGTHHGITVAGIGVANAARVAYRANAYYWTSGSDYRNAALGTIAAASDLDPSGAWAWQVTQAWHAVGVVTTAPHLVFRFVGGTPRSVAPAFKTSFEVKISGVFDDVLRRGTGHLHCSIDGASWRVTYLTEIDSNTYSGELPAVTCGHELRYYVSALDLSGERSFYPDSSQPITVEVASHTSTLFADDFESDQGWTVYGDASTGAWERGVPEGTGDYGDPPSDFDGSGRCFLTENASGDSDVDGGSTNLESPTFDLSGGDAVIGYARWFSNTSGPNPYDDSMVVYISNDNGGNWVPVETAGPSDDASGDWHEHTFRASEFVEPTGLMKLRFEVSDGGDASTVEAAVDAVSVARYECVNPVCGDLSGDDKVNLADITSLISCVYLGQTVPEPRSAGNVDGSADGKINLADITRLIDFVYMRGQPLACW